MRNKSNKFRVALTIVSSILCAVLLGGVIASVVTKTTPLDWFKENDAIVDVPVVDESLTLSASSTGEMTTYLTAEYEGRIVKYVGNTAYKENAPIEIGDKLTALYFNTAIVPDFSKVDYTKCVIGRDTSVVCHFISNVENPYENEESTLLAFVDVSIDGHVTGQRIQVLQTNAYTTFNDKQLYSPYHYMHISIFDENAQTYVDYNEDLGNGMETTWYDYCWLENKYLEQTGGTKEEFEAIFAEQMAGVILIDKQGALIFPEGFEYEVKYLAQQDFWKEYVSKEPFVVLYETDVEYMVVANESDEGFHFEKL